MTIRAATLADVPALVAMGRRFRAETAYRDLLAESVPQLTAMATRLVEGPASVVLVAEGGAGDRDADAAAGALVGMIGLVVFPHHLSAERIAGEVMWWVDPAARGVGIALLTAAERWAAEAGAEAIHLIAPADAEARLEPLYTRRGYQPFERAYQRRVTPALTALTVVDDVLPDPAAYRAAARAAAFGPIETSPGVVFPGLALDPPPTLPAWIQARYPSLTPTLSFFRQSPAGQDEPNFIHTDRDMGEWTGHLLRDRGPAARRRHDLLAARPDRRDSEHAPRPRPTSWPNGSPGATGRSGRPGTPCRRARIASCSSRQATITRARSRPTTAPATRRG